MGEDYVLELWARIYVLELWAMTICYNCDRGLELCTRTVAEDYVLELWARTMY